MISIGAAARQTGITPATLRKWESRYGFPIPLRTAGDHRAFDPSDVEDLIEVSRRIAAGQRAGVAIQSVRLGRQRHTPVDAACAVAYPPKLTHALSLLLRYDLKPFEEYLIKHLTQHGAAVFARDLAIPLIEAIGTLWQQGQLPVYAEHLFSSVLQKVAQQYIARVNPPTHSEPLVLLAAPAGERHTLVLVLLNAMLCEAGVSTLLFQDGLPAREIAGAAQAVKAQVVALSASVAYPPKLLTAELRSLRKLLDAGTKLWVGGAGTQRISAPLDGVTVILSLDAAVESLKSRVGQGQNPLIF